MRLGAPCRLDTFPSSSIQGGPDFATAWGLGANFGPISRKGPHPKPRTANALSPMQRTKNTEMILFFFSTENVGIKLFTGATANGTRLATGRAGAGRPSFHDDAGIRQAGPTTQRNVLVNTQREQTTRTLHA